MFEVLDHEVGDPLAALVVEDVGHEAAPLEVAADGPGLQFAVAQLPAQLLLGDALRTGGLNTPYSQMD